MCRSSPKHDRMHKTHLHLSLYIYIYTYICIYTHTVNQDGCSETAQISCICIHTCTHTQAIRIDIPKQPEIHRMYKTALMSVPPKKRRLVLTAGVQRLPTSLRHAYSALQTAFEAGNQRIFQHYLSADS
jgi:hypothetical protein